MVRKGTKGVSSRKKVTKKADTQSRSTTSSRTKAEGGRQKAEKKRDEGGRLKDEFVQTLLRGGSPAGFVHENEVELDEVFRWLENDEDFHRKVEQAHDALSQNVAAKLYQEAMKGSVTAMTFWLRNCPPSQWMKSNFESQESTELEELTDEELIKFARDQGVDIPIEFEANPAIAGSEEVA